MKEIIFYINAKNNNEIYIQSQNVSKIETSWYKYIDILCIDNLSTLKGRIDAVKQKYGWVKHTPIYVNDETILFYIKSLKENSNYFINAKYVSSISGSENNTYITFNNNEKISLKVSYKKVKLYYEKAKILLNNL